MHPSALIYLAISNKKTLSFVPFLIPATLLSPLSSSKSLITHFSRFIPLSTFPSHSLSPLSNSIPSHFCKKKEFVFHPYPSSGLIRRLVNIFVISGTVTLGPSFERHRGTSLALHFVLPFSQPRPSLLGEAWIHDLFLSVIMNDSTTHRRQKLP